MEGGIALDNKNVPRNLPGPPGNKSVVQKARGSASGVPRLYEGPSNVNQLLCDEKSIQRASFLRNLLSFSKDEIVLRRFVAQRNSRKNDFVFRREEL